MGALLLLCALGAAPAQKAGPLAMLVVRRTSLDAVQGQQLAAAAAALLSKQGVALEDPAESLRRLSVLGVTDPTACGGRKACVLELLRQLGCPAGIALSMSQVGPERSVAFEAWRTKDGALLATDAVVLKPGASLDTAALTTLARSLAKAYPAQAAADAPVAEVSPPPATTPPVELAPAAGAPAEKPQAPTAAVTAPAPAPAGRSHIVGATLAVAAVVAASVAAGFGGGALTAQGDLNRGTTDGISRYTATQAQRLADASNQRAIVSGVAAGAAVALGVGAVVAW